MDTSRILTGDGAPGAAKAIGQLEQANRRLLECSPFDAAETEAALAQRDEAVRAVAAADTDSLDEPLAKRLLRAFEDGRRIRGKLAAFYRDCDGQWKRFERMHAGDRRPPESPGISSVG